MRKKNQHKKLKLTLIRSLAGRLKKHRSMAECLGLRRIRQSTQVEANPTTIGMIKKVSYLLKVEEMSS